MKKKKDTVGSDSDGIPERLFDEHEITDFMNLQSSATSPKWTKEKLQELDKKLVSDPT